MFIAIEIDEPYTVDSSNTLIPIHIKGSDTERENNFTKRGWTVIRFAEEQIAKWPQLCVDVVSHFINTGQLSNMNRINRWTFDEAKEMIKNSYRNDYLPFAFKSMGIESIKSSASYRSFEIINLSLREKNGKKFVQIHLDYPCNINECGDKIATGNHPQQSCVDREIFLSKIYASKFGKLCNEYSMHTIEDMLWFDSKEGIIMIEGYGKRNNEYFNFLDNNFKIVFSNEFLENTKKYWLSIINKERIKLGLPELT